jgi:replicative DNA helicase
MNDIKTAPNNTEAERAVLGSILLDATGRSDERIMDVCLTSGVVAETFYDPRNRTVYSMMLDMNRRAKPLDALTLIEELRVSNKLEAVGGVGYVQSLIDQVPTTAHAEHYMLVDYIEQRDLESFTALMQKHIERSKETCLMALKESKLRRE